MAEAKYGKSKIPVETLLPPPQLVANNLTPLSQPPNPNPLNGSAATPLTPTKSVRRSHTYVLYDSVTLTVCDSLERRGKGRTPFCWQSLYLSPRLFPIVNAFMDH